jgi:hypothetical protein
MSTAAYTELRALTPFEAQAVARLRVLAAQSPLVLQSLIAELVVSREAVKEIRRVRRCLPPRANAALDGLPHRRVTAREFDHA